MNFFEHQDRARRNTGLLVLYFILAVVAICACVSLALFIFLGYFGNGQFRPQNWFTSPLFFWSAGASLAVILIGTLRKSWQLRDGGEGLARMLHAREITPDTHTLDERKLRNVVEEMALASGIPAPRTYVLDNEQGINAFVAGYRPGETVVVVTAGTLEKLNRDQLQGVIAHEFSHIFNADMRINMRLMAVLAGILLIGKIGEFLLRGTSSGSSSRRRRDGRAALFGLALIVIGYVGLFFGRLIKAAISRQRELLADASAVQFTRQPDGIAGALIQIRNGGGSYLQSVHAEDMNHMCFGDTVKLRMRSLLATHPPIDERLAAIGPDWPARARVDARQRFKQSRTPEAIDDEQAQVADRMVSALAGAAAVAAGGASLKQQIGTVSPPQLDYAARLHRAIPEALKQRLRTRDGARQTIEALAICGSRNDLDSLMPLLPAGSDRQALASLTAEIEALDANLKLPLLDLAMPALKQFDQDSRDQLCAELDKLVRADGKITLFEFALVSLVREHLRKHAGRALHVRFHRFTQLEADIQLLFSLAVHASGSRDADAAELFSRSVGTMLPRGRALLPLERCSLSALQRSLENLRDLAPLLKGPLVDALADLICADNQVRAAEFELLRAVCSLIDCPVPPLDIHNA